MKKIVFALLALSATGAISGPAAAQSLTGKRVGIQYFFPTASDLYENKGANTVGVDGPTTGVAGIFDIGFTGSTATASNFANNAFWNPTDFNGFRLYDIDGTIGDFKVTLGASNMLGLDASRITGDANNVYVNWQGLAFDPSTSVTLNFAAGVPEPATWALMILGFGAVGGALRRRQKVATAVRFA